MDECQSRGSSNTPSERIRIRSRIPDGVTVHIGPIEEPITSGSGNCGPMGMTLDLGVTLTDRFPTLSRLTRRYLATPTTSCPVERLFSVTGQVDTDRGHPCRLTT